MTESLFPDEATPAASMHSGDADRERLRTQVAALAARGVFLGTSSWKYPGWIGSVYSESRYVFRGKLSEARFQERCLAEYAELFPTVGVDATYYSLPTVEYVRGLAELVPHSFQFSFKVTDEFTVKRFPPIPRHGDRGGQPNPGFLDAHRFADAFLRPLEGIRSQVGLIFFEFSRFYAPDFARGRDFIAALDGFLAQLPAGWRYGVEVRNRNLLRTEFFGVLRAHGTTFVFNQWSNGTPLDFQLRQPAAWTAAFAGARLLTRPGTNYEAREDQMAPFDRIQEPFPEARAAVVAMIGEAQRRAIPLYVYFGNKFEGCAPASLKAVTEA